MEVHAFRTYILKILETIGTLKLYLRIFVRINFERCVGTSLFFKGHLKLILDFSYKLCEHFRYKFVTLWSGTFLLIVIRMNSSLIFLSFVHIHNYALTFFLVQTWIFEISCNYFFSSSSFCINRINF
ncbi:hypothetical protein RCL_jg6804.t2 [Rhizophagus clarus]|uniref:Uncharacterized protein n=1 Tax=Rhizophagus clarus TaxID=94130 RepID=A0A8H3LE58_9GLOM|nr:hypothetical protein RCL_jg6804.t2 [Rhizophagus clarus]